MIVRLEIPGAWMWTDWDPDRGMSVNSYLFERAGGCIVVDPLPLEAHVRDALQRLGGVQTVVVTGRDRERAARELCAAFNATLSADFVHGAEVFPGAIAVLMTGKHGGAGIALHLPDCSAAVVGDALAGVPAGALTLGPYAPLALRRLWALQAKTLLLCHGQPLFAGADEALTALLETSAGAEINRINVDELEFAPRRRHDGYAFDDGEVGQLIGARKLGYRVARIAPGMAFCPLHWHVAAEEFFYVIDGNPSIRTSRGTFACRPGDFIAFPTGERGAHQLRNDSAAPALVLMAGMEEEAVNLEACFYPDSEKVGLFTTDGRLRMVRSSPDLDYFDGE